MRKTLIDLKPGDTVYVVEPNSLKISYTETIEAVYKQAGRIEIQTIDGRSPNSNWRRDWKTSHVANKHCLYDSSKNANSTAVLFCNEDEALRFAKSRTFKELERHKIQLEAAFKALQKFREENYESLNHTYLEPYITGVTKKINQNI